MVCDRSMRKGNDKFGNSRVKKRNELGFNLTIILLEKYEDWKRGEGVAGGGDDVLTTDVNII